MTFFKLVGCKMSSRKIIKLNGTPESFPTAWELRFFLGNFQKLNLIIFISILAIETYKDYNIGFSTALYQEICVINERCRNAVANFDFSMKKLLRELTKLQKSLFDFWENKILAYLDLTEQLFTPFSLVFNEISELLDLLNGHLNES